MGWGSAAEAFDIDMPSFDTGVTNYDYSMPSFESSFDSSYYGSGGSSQYDSFNSNNYGNFDSFAWDPGTQNFSFDDGGGAFEWQGADAWDNNDDLWVSDYDIDQLFKVPEDEWAALTGANGEDGEGGFWDGVWDFFSDDDMWNSVGGFLTSDEFLKFAYGAMGKGLQYLGNSTGRTSGSSGRSYVGSGGRVMSGGDDPIDMRFQTSAGDLKNSAKTYQRRTRRS